MKLNIEEARTMTDFRPQPGAQQAFFERHEQAPRSLMGLGGCHVAAFDPVEIEEWRAANQRRRKNPRSLAVLIDRMLAPLDVLRDK